MCHLTQIFIYKFCTKLCNFLHFVHEKCICGCHEARVKNYLETVDKHVYGVYEVYMLLMWTEMWLSNSSLVKKKT